MRINEIESIGQLNSIIDRWSSSIITNSKYLITINGELLYHYYDSIDNLDLYFLIDKDQNLLSYIGTGKIENGYTQLLRVENVSKKPGLIFYLLKGLIGLGYKFFISEKEGLTLDGLKWLTKLIKLHSFNITDQNRNTINIKDLNTEWMDHLTSNKNGLTRILIENNNIDGEKLLKESKVWENKRNNIGLLMPMYNFYDNENLP